MARTLQSLGLILIIMEKVYKDLMKGYKDDTLREILKSKNMFEKQAVDAALAEIRKRGLKIKQPVNQ